MKVTITFRNIDHTESLDEKIRQKGHKLDKYFGPEAEMHWTCWVENKDQFAEVKVNHKGHHYIAKAYSEDLYKTMDMVVDKISNQVAHGH